MSLEIIISEFNALLSKLLKDIDYCPHDSEYRIYVNLENKEEFKKIISELNYYVKTYPVLVYDTCVYSSDYYPLTAYHYHNDTHYAGKVFKLTNREHIEAYCGKYDLRTNSYVINNNDKKPGSEFERDMAKMAKKYKYVLPTRLQILYRDPNKTAMFESDEEIDWDMVRSNEETVCLLSRFEFVDVLKLKDIVSLL